jgi:hypothetical protein
VVFKETMKSVPTFIEVLVGQTIKAVSPTELESGDKEITLTTIDPAGKEHTYRFYHEQDCCEHVAISKVKGDLTHLHNQPITATSENVTGGETCWGSQTVTVYTFTTAAGTVTVTWLGESNGYYSESVSFDEVVK